MAQFNSLLVTGDSRFINPINGNARNGIYCVSGTQTAATGSWTGVIPVPALYDGLTIMYYLPYAGSGNATLNLTLSDGTTTGAINCYFRKTERLTTHFPSGSSIVMTYHPAGSIKYDGTATTDNRWVVNASYLDGNDGAYYDREIYVRATTGSVGIFPYTLLMRLPDGRWESIVTSSSTGTGKARNTHGFLFGQLAYIGYNETFAENALISDYRLWTRYTNLVDYRYSLNLVNNATQGFTGNKPIYLVGSIGNDGLFYIDANMWAKALPSSADGKIYMYIGDAFDWYRGTFYGSSSFKAYVYTNGHVREYCQDASTVGGHTVAKDVPSNAVFTDTKNTAGSTNTSSKIYLIGATSQAANPQTYSNSGVSVKGTGELSAHTWSVKNSNDYSRAECYVDAEDRGRLNVYDENGIGRIKLIGNSGVTLNDSSDTTTIFLDSDNGRVECDKMSYTNGTVTFSKSSGSWTFSNGEYTRSGQVVQIRISFKGGGSNVSVGSNAIAGTINGIPHPPYTIRLQGYYSGTVLMGELTTSGGFNVRILGQALNLSSSNTATMSGTYVVED